MSDCLLAAPSPLSRFHLKSTAIERQRNETFYLQGEPSDAIFCLWSGHVKLTVVSNQGKEAVVGILGPGDFFGEACLSGGRFRDSTATGVTNCAATKIKKLEAQRALRTEPDFCEFFLSYVLGRNARLEADLADQLCNSCERRLARTLLSLTHMRHGPESTSVIPKIDQQTLAAMVGTTQPRISFFLSRFREKGFIEYSNGLRVNSSLLTTALGHADDCGGSFEANTSA